LYAFRYLHVFFTLIILSIKKRPATLSRFLTITQSSSSVNCFSYISGILSAVFSGYFSVSLPAVADGILLLSVVDKIFRFSAAPSIFPFSAADDISSFPLRTIFSIFMLYPVFSSFRYERHFPLFRSGHVSEI
jgi:hypothetical protein